MRFLSTTSTPGERITFAFVSVLYLALVTYCLATSDRTSALFLTLYTGMILLIAADMVHLLWHSWKTAVAWIIFTAGLLTSVYYHVPANMRPPLPLFIFVYELYGFAVLSVIRSVFRVTYNVFAFPAK